MRSKERTNERCTTKDKLNENGSTFLAYEMSSNIYMLNLLKKNCSSVACQRACVPSTQKETRRHC